MAIHANLASGRWNELSFAEQMGNIGSEVSRACVASARGQAERRDKSIERALELVDLTLRTTTSQPRMRELGLFRNAIEAAAEGSSSVRLEAIEQYCVPFALIARKHT